MENMTAYKTVSFAQLEVIIKNISQGTSVSINNFRLTAATVCEADRDFHKNNINNADYTTE